MNIIKETVWNQKQSWHFEKVGSIGDVKVRLYVRRNAYDDQSYAIAEVWSLPLMQWNRVHRMDGATMSACDNMIGKPGVPEISYTREAVSPRGIELAEEDLGTLEMVVAEILT